MQKAVVVGKARASVLHRVLYPQVHATGTKKNKVIYAINFDIFRCQDTYCKVNMSRITCLLQRKIIIIISRENFEKQRKSRTLPFTIMSQ